MGQLSGNQQTPGVIGATAVAHRSGDKPVDSVDNTGNALSPRVTKGPEKRLDTPRVSGNPSEGGLFDTQSEQPPAPNGATDTEGKGATTGRDLAHAALESAKAKAKARGVEPGMRRGRITGGGAGANTQSPRRRRWSGPGADTRDPQPLGRLASRIAVDRGWNTRLANGQVFGHWARLVGEEVAEHAQPVALKDGELTVRASSTAWATQLRLLQGQLLAKIAAGVGHGVVKRMRIQGPTAPSWKKGPRVVPGRGPRDTYG